MRVARVEKIPGGASWKLVLQCGHWIEVQGKCMPTRRIEPCLICLEDARQLFVVAASPISTGE